MNDDRRFEACNQWPALWLASAILWAVACTAGSESTDVRGPDEPVGASGTMDAATTMAHAGAAGGPAQTSGDGAGDSGGSVVFPGPPGTRSLSCDGTAVGVTIPNAPELEILGDWTIEMWFKDDEAWCHTWRFLVRKGDEFNDPYFIATEDCGVRLGQKSNWNYFTQLENLQQAGYNAGWLHVAATYKAAQHLGQIYINGEPKFASEQPMNGAPTAVGKPVTMCNSFKGQLDDVRLWNVVRSASDIKEAYTGQLEEWPPELVANWTFDDDAGSAVVHDVTLHHHDGALQKGATISSAVHP